MDSILTHEIIKRINLWYKWQLNFSEKRVFLRRFPEFVKTSFYKQKITDIKPFLDTLFLIQPGEASFYCRITAVNRLFRVFDYVDVNRKMRNKPTDYYSTENIKDRADTFISEFDTLMRDMLQSEQNCKNKRKLKKKPLEDEKSSEEEQKNEDDFWSPSESV